MTWNHPRIHWNPETGEAMNLKHRLLSLAPGLEFDPKYAENQEKARGKPDKWLKQPDLKREIKRERAKLDCVQADFKPPKPLCAMTTREIKGELSRQARRLQKHQTRKIGGYSYCVAPSDYGFQDFHQS